jgi:hypothetical protein
VWAGSSDEKGYEVLGSIKVGEFNQMGSYQHIKKDSASWS